MAAGDNILYTAVGGAVGDAIRWRGLSAASGACGSTSTGRSARSHRMLDFLATTNRTPTS